MVQLKVLSGKNAGYVIQARDFPLILGRHFSVGALFEEEGVWDNHLQITFTMADGFRLCANPSALTIVNGRKIEEALLRQGDLIEMGSVKLQFWLSEVRQRGLRPLEILTWTAIGVITLVQVGLIYELVR